MQLRTTQRKLNQDLYAKILKEFLTKPSTDQYQLAEITGLRVETVRDLLRAYYRNKCTHIVGWLPNGRGIDTTPVFALGEGEDAPKKRKPLAQVKADHNAKRKAGRADKRETKKRVKADPLLALAHQMTRKNGEPT